MESLLRWGIQNSTPAPDGTVPVPRTDIDTAIIDHILGKPDSVLMKEALDIAVDPTHSDQTRIQALDDFEMLVENIDNANDLKKLNMWEPLQAMLTSPSSENVKMQVLWAIGTAIQNNPSAQESYLSLRPISTILSFLSPSIESPQLRSKAMYTLSGLCKHNAAALLQLDELGGWDSFRSALEDSDITVRRKTVFLLNSLLMPSDSEMAENAGTNLHTPASSDAPIHANSHASMLRDPSSISTSKITMTALEKKGLLKALIDALINPVPHGQDGDSNGDTDFEEKVVHLLCTYLTLRSGGFAADASQVAQLKRYVDEQVTKAGGEENLRETWNVSLEEFSGLQKALA